MPELFGQFKKMSTLSSLRW